MVSDHKKLTNWKNEPTLQQLQADFSGSISSHQDWISKIESWNGLMEAKSPVKIKGRSSVQPKLIRKQAEWRYPALSEPFLNSHKLFKVSPVTFEDSAAAKQNELVLNYQFRNKLNRVKLIDDLVRSTVDDGTSVVRVGWERKVTHVMETTVEYTYFPIEDEASLAGLQQALELSVANPREFDLNVPEELKAAVSYYQETQTPVVAIPAGTRLVEVPKVLVNNPTVEVLNPANVYIDPSCNGDFDRAMFVVTTRETNKAELLKDAYKYKNLDKIDWEKTSTFTDANHKSSTPEGFTFADVARKRVIVYEYWGYYDIDGNGCLKPILASWIGSTLIYLEESPFSDGKLPFVITTYLPVKRELYGQPDAELLSDNQAIQGAVSRGIIDLLARSANSQRGLAKGMLDPLNRRRYEQGQDYEFNPQINPMSGGIVEHKYPEIPQSALLMLNLQANEAESLTGVKSFSGGVSGAAYGDVAAGIRGALDASSKREMAILRRIAQGVIAIGKKIIAMNYDFLSDEETIRITNTEFVKIRREDLGGEFDLDTDINTAEVDNNKVQDLAFLLQTIGNTMEAGITKMILSEIAQLKRMPELAEKIRTFVAEPDQAQQQLQQLAIQKAQMEISVLESEIMLNNAKAGQLKSVTDKNYLDYAEQEAGTTHERAMQRHKAQAKGNQELQITKALVSPRKLDTHAPDIEAAIGYNRLQE